MQNFTELKTRTDLRAYASQHLDQVRGHFICPVCKSGTHGNKTPAFSIKNDFWKCFSCNSSGDIFDLAGYINATQDKKEQYELVEQWAGCDTNRQAVPTPTPKPAENYIRECKRNIEHPSAVAYLETRKIDLDTARQLGLGFDPSARRIVIPWKGYPSYWIARDITGESPRKYTKPKTEEAGKQPLWNQAALHKESYFVVEGPFDALAVEMLGYDAVSLGGTSAGPLLEQISKTGSKACAILMLDADEAGRKAQARLKQTLREAGIPCIDLPGKTFAKDADEMRVQDPAALRELLADAVRQARDHLEATRQEQSSRALKNLRVASVASLADEILAGPTREDFVPTGIRGLDTMLDGGLRPGLTVLAAASSLGKTTLCVQMADKIALSGHRVLYVTLEQSAKDLVVKSIGRNLFELSAGETCLSAHDMANPANRRGWDDQTRERFEEAVRIYQQGTAPNLEVLEGIGRTSVSDIAAYAQVMADEADAPIVFVDYLQLLVNEGTQDERLSVSRSVTDLRRLARDLQTPVVCVSAVRRENYLMPVTLDSMKESGAIEYGADVVLGLQAAGVDMGEPAGSDRRARRQADRKARAGKVGECREVELVVLKQRDGRVHGPDQAIPLTFVPQAATFI